MYYDQLYCSFEIFKKYEVILDYEIGTQANLCICVRQFKRDPSNSLEYLQGAALDLYSTENNLQMNAGIQL